MTLNPYTQAYTTIIAWSNKVPTIDIQDEGQRAFVAEQLVDDYYLKVNDLGQKEWKKLFHATCNYLDTVRTHHGRRIS